MADTPPIPYDPQSPTGDYGGGISARRVRLETTRLLERAVREQWPIPDEFREPVVKRQVRIAIGHDSSSREATSAARCLVSMQAQNQEAAFKALDKTLPDQVEQRVSVETRVSIETLLSNPEYVEFLRYRAIAEDCDPSLPCQIPYSGYGRAMENGAPPGGSGQGAG